MRIKVKVAPRAKQNKITRLSESEYKVHLTAAPADGKANEALVKMLAEEFKVAKSSVQIIRGHSGREKLVEIG